MKIFYEENNGARREVTLQELRRIEDEECVNKEGYSEFLSISEIDVENDTLVIMKDGMSWY